MKVLHACKYYYPYVGGIETVIKNTVDGLKNYEDVMVEVFAVQNGNAHSAVDYVNNVKVTRVKNNGIISSMPISLKYRSGLGEKMKEFDIVHFHMPFPLAELSSLFCSYDGKIVATWHSEIVKQKFALKCYKPFMKKFLNRADKIIIASENNLKNSAVLREYKNKCAVVPYGIDVDSIKKDMQKLHILKGRENKVKILFVGRFVYYKGIDVLLNAFKDIDDADLFLVGQGPLFLEMKELADKLGIMDRTFFLGALSDEELNSSFMECDMLVLPSIKNSEAFGMVQLEAMARKKPVINTRLNTGVPFVSLDSLTGLTVEPNDAEGLTLAMQKLIGDKELREKMGRAGYNRLYEMFTAKKMVQNIYGIYKSLL